MLPRSSSSNSLGLCVPRGGEVRCVTLCASEALCLWLGDTPGRPQCLTLLPPVPAPPTFRQPFRGPRNVVPVRAGDKAVLDCETDSIPEPAVTWYKDGQPLVLAQQTPSLPGGQRLEIQDTQVGSPVVWAAIEGCGFWACMEGGQLCSRVQGLISNLQGQTHGKSTGPRPGCPPAHRMTLSRSTTHSLPHSPQDLEAFFQALVV